MRIQKKKKQPWLLWNQKIWMPKTLIPPRTLIVRSIHLWFWVYVHLSSPFLITISLLVMYTKGKPVLDTWFLFSTGTDSTYHLLLSRAARLRDKAAIWIWPCHAESDMNLGLSRFYSAIRYYMKLLVARSAVSYWIIFRRHWTTKIIDISFFSF